MSRGRHSPTAPGSPGGLFGGVERPGLWLGVLALTALATHFPMVLGADALDADRAIVLLMAEAFAEGNFSLYFWGQNYMASFEALLLTPLALAGVLTPATAAMVGLGLAVGLTWICLTISRRLGGQGLVVALLWAFPPAVVAHHHVAFYGARLPATAMIVGAFAMTLTATSTRRWVGIGALAGLAFMGDHLMVFWLPALVWMAWPARRLGPMVTGALPIVLFDAVAAFVTPATHLSGPNDPAAWIHTPLTLIGTAIPQLLGILWSRGPGPDYEIPPGVVPEGFLWVVLAIPALLAWGLLALGARPSIRGTKLEARAGQALVLTLVASAGLFLVIGGDGERWTVRYLVPAWPALTLLAGLGVKQLQASGVGVGRIGLLVGLLLLPFASTHWTDPTWPNPARGEAAREEAEAIGDLARAAGAEWVWADYWDAYRLNVLQPAPPTWVTIGNLDRRPDHTAAALAAPAVSYLVRSDDIRTLEALDRVAQTEGVQPFDLPRHRFYPALAGSRPELISTGGLPEPARAAAAALGPMLLFLGTLGGAVFLASLRARRDPPETRGGRHSA